MPDHERRREARTAVCVPFEHRVVHGLAQQHAVGHVLDDRLRRGAILEADRIAHLLPEPAAKLLGDALGDRHGGDAARLRAAHDTKRSVAVLVQVPATKRAFKRQAFRRRALRREPFIREALGREARGRSRKRTVRSESSCRCQSLPREPY